MATFRGFFGHRLVRPRVAPGDDVLLAGSGRSARLKEIVTFDGKADRAREGGCGHPYIRKPISTLRAAICLRILASRPECVDQFAAHVIWMSEQPLVPGRSYLLKIGDAHRAGHHYLLLKPPRRCGDTGAFWRIGRLGLNEIGFCNLVDRSACGL